MTAVTPANKRCLQCRFLFEADEPVCPACGAPGTIKRSDKVPCVFALCVQPCAGNNPEQAPFCLTCSRSQALAGQVTFNVSFALKKRVLLEFNKGKLVNCPAVVSLMRAMNLADKEAYDTTDWSEKIAPYITAKFYLYGLVRGFKPFSKVPWTPDIAVIAFLTVFVTPAGKMAPPFRTEILRYAMIATAEYMMICDGTAATTKSNDKSSSALIETEHFLDSLRRNVGARSAVPQSHGRQQEESLRATVLGTLKRAGAELPPGYSWDTMDRDTFLGKKKKRNNGNNDDAANDEDNANNAFANNANANAIDDDDDNDNANKCVVLRDPANKVMYFDSHATGKYPTLFASLCERAIHECQIDLLIFSSIKVDSQPNPWTPLRSRDTARLEKFAAATTAAMLAAGLPVQQNDTANHHAAVAGRLPAIKTMLIVSLKTTTPARRGREGTEPSTHAPNDVDE
jgi:hypothetical protein